jgi:1A family penicillin-binding protein
MKKGGNAITKLLRIVFIVILAVIFVSLGIVAGIVVGYWGKLPSLDALEYQESEKWKFHLEVYSNLTTIEEGDTKEYLLDKLKRLGYTQVGGNLNKGEYSSSTEYMRIYINDFQYPRLLNSGYLVALRFRDNRIASIEKEDGTKIQNFYLEPELISGLYGAEGTARQLVRLPDIPKSLLEAFIVTEDKRFYKHWGIDIFRVIKAMYKNIMARQIVEGSGTITMQLARYLFLTRNQTIQRKIQEALLALKIERKYSKDEILERYLNFIDLGRYGSHQIYGVQQASLSYFGKPVWDLSLDECALLAALPKSSSRYSPLKYPDRAQQRRNLVLRIMLKRGYITQEQYETSVKKPLKIRLPAEVTTANNAPHFLEYIKIQLENKYKSTMLYTEGLKVYTTLDTTLQTIANEAIGSGLRKLDKELGFPNYDENDPDAPNGLDPLKYIQGALVATDPKTGYIKAMVGGRDFYISRNILNYFNRAVQAKRQPGSAFKPFVYCAAFSRPAVANPASTIDDEPWGIDEDRKHWMPENYEKRYLGTITLWTALTKSINVATARLMNERVGIDRTISMAKKMGIKSELRRVPSLALGSSEVTLLEITSAYNVFANKGFYTEPLSILYVVNQRGDILEENLPRTKRVIDETIAYQMTYLLQGVIDEGTGRRARQAPLNFHLPAAGKTGTTNDYSDAWFIGYIPDLVAGVWVGFDDPKVSIEHTGATAAIPIWVNFMKKAAYHTIKDFGPKPSNIIFLEIDKSTGMLRNQNCPEEDIVRIPFIRGNQPTELCTEHP